MHMPSRRTIRITVLISVVLLLSIAGVWMALSGTPKAQASQITRDAWTLLNQASRYEFSTTVEQTTFPAPSLSNVGRSSKTETYQVSGKADLQAGALDVSLWQNDGSLLGSDGRLDIRVAGGKASGRIDGGAWEELPDFSASSFTSSNNTSMFLTAARSVRFEKTETIAWPQPDGTTAQMAVQRFHFEVDPRRYAEVMRDQLVAELQRSGKLPMGLNLSASDRYRGMEASGELWVDADGLPVRMTVSMKMPPEESGERVEAQITTDFFNYARENLLASRPLPFRLAGMLGLPLTRDGLDRLLLVAGLTCALLSLLVLVVFNTQRKAVYAGVASLVIFSMLFSPLWEGSRSVAFAQDMAEQKARYDASQEQAKASQQAAAEAAADLWDPHANPQEKAALPAETADEPAASPAQPSSSGLFSAPARPAAESVDPAVDSDGDGLTDDYENQFNDFEAQLQEEILNPNDADTDDDGLSDGIEVKLDLLPGESDTDGDRLPDQREVTPFVYNSLDWYSNPDEKDTDGDGRLDGAECYARVTAANGVCADTDGDGAPDIFDRDDDGDGVPSLIDASPMAASSETFTATNPLKLTVSNLNADKPVFITYQLRPTNSKHLTYALNVLDWPSDDTDGQIQRVSETTFADGDPDQEDADPRAGYGDLRLLPMVEVHLTGSTLPLPLTDTLSFDFADGDFTGKFTLKGASGSTQVTLAQAPAGTYALYHGAGTCKQFDPGSQTANKIGDLGPAGSGSLAVALGALLDGGHVLYTTGADGSVSHCVEIPAAAHGTLTDQVIDTTQLQAYGGIARNDTDGSVFVYAPLSVVRESDGNVPTAFTSKIPFTNAGSRFSGSTQEVRMIWLINMIADVCKPMETGYDPDTSGAWCDAGKAARWDLDVSRIVQTYGDEFKLTGLAVQEDHGVDMAVVYENPLTDPDPGYDDPLWLLSRGLEGSFASGRADMTVAEIEHRFDPQHNTDIPADDARLWSQNKDAFQVERYQYSTADGVYDFMSTRVQQLFAGSFSSLPAEKDVDNATLLFARSLSERSVSFGESAAACVSGTCAFDFSAAGLMVQAVLNWAPYRRVDGAWESYPLQEYLDHLEALLRAENSYRPADGSDEAKYLVDGQIYMARLYYESFFRGIATLVSLNGTPVINIAAVIDDQNIDDDFYQMNRKAQGITKVFKSVTEALIAGLEKSPNLLTSGMGLKQGTAGFFKAVGEGYGQKLGGLAKKLGPALTKAAAVVAIALVVVIAAGLIMYLADPDGTVGRIGMRMLLTGVSLLSAGLAIGALASAWAAYKAGESVSKAAKGAAIVGLVIGLLITWGVFFYMWGSSGLEAGSLALNNMAADAIAATIVIVLMAALACTGVGAVIVAAIALIDALISAICAAAGVYEEDEDNFWRQYVCIGITGWATKIIKWFIYSQTYIIDYDNSERLQFGGLDQNVQDPYKGMSTGNNLSISLDVTNTITGSSVPLDWKAAAYWWQYGDSYDKSATFAYKVQPTETGIHSGLERYAMSGQWVTVPNENKKWSAEFHAATDGYSIVMPEPGINRDPTAYVTEGSAVPVQECFVVPVPAGIVFLLVPVCYLRTERASFSVPLGDSLTVDVFPQTLDKFYELTETGSGGYSLAWGRDQTLKFPTLMDADGDGVVSKAFSGGTDPNDSTFDTDNDGLDDGFELNQGLDPNLFDTDDDGLYDAEEVRIGTSPTRIDTDGDGLPDKDEVDGWLFTYGFTASGAPLETMVYPDPFSPDTDFDGLTDLLERTYGFNPNVPDNADVLSYALSVREADAPLVMLRFEEAGGASIFADSSGFGFSAGCSGDPCPLAGLDGRFGRAIDLDGADDALTIHNTAGRIAFDNAKPFTLAAWIYLDEGSNGGAIISKWGDTAANKEVLLDVTSTGNLRLSSSAASLTGSGTLPYKTWTHVAATFDGSQAALYVDGIQDGAAGWSGSAAISASDFAVGGTSGAYLEGRLDEVAIFDRALSEAEVTDRLMTARYNFNDTLVRPQEEVTYHSLVENLLNSRYAYALLTTLVDWKEAIVDWATKLLPKTFVLYPDNPVVTGVNTKDVTETFQIAGVDASGSLTLTQTVAAQIVDRRTESNMAELWLKFDEGGSAASFEDFSGNMPPRPGTCSTCPASGLTDAVLNNSIRFNAGAGASVALPTLDTLRMVNRGYTVSLWVKPGTPSGSGQVIDLIASTGSPFRLYLESTAQGNYLPRVMVNNSLVAMTTWRWVQPNAWTHLAVVYRFTATEQTLQVYVNGAAVASATGVSPIASSAALTLGGAMPVSTLVDDLRIFSRPLSLVDINRLAELPVLKLEMDGSSGSAVTDSSKYGQTVGIGAGGWPARTPNSIRGQAMTPGSGIFQDYLRVTGNQLLNMQDGAFTFSVWIYPKPEGEDQWQGVFGLNSGEASAYPTLERKGSVLRFAFGDGTAFQTKQSGAVLNTSQWNHVVVTFQPSASQTGFYEYRLYVNGAERDSFLFNTKPTSASTFYVGHSSTKYTATAEYFHVSSHDDPGSAAEVKWYKNGSGIWGRGDVYSGNDYSINNSETFYNHESVTYSCDEEDSWPNPDDGCGSHSLYWYLWPGQYTGHCSDGFNGTLYMSVSKPSTEFRGSIDMLEVYRYAIDREQVYDLYNSIPITARLPLDDRPSSQSFTNLAFIGDQDNGECTDPYCPAAGTVGLINQATRFDGEDDRITVDVNTTSDYMVSLWVNTLRPSSGLYSLNSTAGGSAIQQIYLENGNACAVTGSTRLCTRGGEIANGEWHHLVYANNGSTTTLWVDGEIANSIAGGSAVPAAPSGQAVLGYASDADEPTLNGQLDDVRVFRYSQAAEVVAQLKQRAPLFFAHLDETATTAGMEDATPMDWRLTCTGDQCPRADMEGRLGRSMEFDGVDDALALEQASFSGATESFSVSIWVMPTQAHSTPQTLWTLAKPDNSGSRYSVAIAPNSMKLCVLTGNSTADCTGQSNVELILNNWNFVTLTVQRQISTVEQYSLYINGYLDSTGVGSSGALVSNGLGKLTVGNKQAGVTQTGGPFGGRLDEPAIFEYLLNEIDVRDTFHYQMAQVEERESLTLTIDADNPTAALASFNPDFPYLAGPDLLMQVDAGDETSDVALVEMNVARGGDSTQVTAPVCLGSTSATSFCPTFTPAFGNGAYDLTLRAVDQVGNEFTSPQPYRIYLDNVAPRIVVDQKSASLQVHAARQHPSLKHTWYLDLSGDIVDPIQDDGSAGSGIDPATVRVSVRNSLGETIGSGTLIPELTATVTGYDWQARYLFPELEPTGKLTIVVEAADQVGNATVETADILLDATASKGKLNGSGLPQGSGSMLAFAPGDPAPVLSEGELSGTASDVPEDGAPYLTGDGKGADSGVGRVQVAFNPSVDASYLFNEPYPQGVLAWLPLDKDEVPLGANGDPDPSLPQRTFLDISPYQYAGACEGAHCPQAGVAGHKSGSIHFNGDQQYINLGASVDLAQRSFTVSIWARRDQPGRNDPMLWQGPLSISGQRFLFGLGADNRMACGFGGTDLLSAQAYTDTAWHSWSCTYDQATGRRAIYRDGVEIAADTAVPVPVMNESLYVGLAPVGSFQGYLDELVILDHALTAAEVRDQYTGFNTVYHLTVDENFYAHGDTLPDRSGYFQTAVLDAGADDPDNKVTAGLTGDFALAFDGDDRLIVQPAYSLRLDRAAFTQTAWIYPTGAGEQDVISQRDGNPEERYPSLTLTADNKLKAGFGTAYAWRGVQTSGPVVTLNEWNLVAASFDGTTYRLYVNGSLVLESDDLAGLTPYPVDHFTIGDRFTGSIDDVRIYTRALSDLEIRALAGHGWLDATLTGGSPVGWTSPVVAGLEGPYQIDVRGWDTAGHFDTGRQVVHQWGGLVDTLAPRFSAERELVDPANPFLMRYTFVIEDTLLDESSIRQNLCPEAQVEREYYNSSWYLATGVAPNTTLYRLSGTCETEVGTIEEVGIFACDLAGHCASQVWPALLQTQAFLPFISGSGDGSGTPPQPRPEDLEAIRQRAQGWPTLQETISKDDPGGSPTVEILTGQLGAADLRSPMFANLKGLVSDDGRVVRVEIRILSGDTVVHTTQAAVYGEVWNALWTFEIGAAPANGTYTVEATAVDAAGHAATVRKDITVQLAP